MGGWREIEPFGGATKGGTVTSETEAGGISGIGGAGAGGGESRTRREGKGAYMRLTVEVALRDPSPRFPGFVVRALLKMPSGTTRSRRSGMSSIVRNWPSVNLVK